MIRTCLYLVSYSLAMLLRKSFECLSCNALKLCNRRCYVLSQYVLPSTEYFRTFQSLPTQTMAQRTQKFDYFLVIDFEATCGRDKKMVPQEIIEFPVLKVNGKTFSVDDRFHQYVQPEINKELTSFCTELTGIIQDQVDGQPDLQKTLQLFDQWMKSQGLLEPGVSSVFVTCGDWDLKTMLPQQCKYFNIEVPNYFKHWINIKKPFCDLTGTFPKGMMPMLQMMNLKHEGRHHSGIDDCQNIARILKSLAERGYSFKVTGHL